MDHVEDLVKRCGLKSLELLLALPEVLSCGDMLALITMCRVPLKALGLRATREPPEVPFRPCAADV